MNSALSQHLSFIDSRLPAWLRQATTAQRKQLQRRVRASHRATRQLKRALATLQAMPDFCRPLLAQALGDWYPDRDLPSGEQGWLWNHDQRHGASWLQAALQNFDAGAEITLYASRQAAQPLPIDAARFVSGIRNLDLGQRYQDHLSERLDTDVFRQQLRAQDHAAFAADLCQAKLQGHIDSRGERLGEAALAAISLIPAVQGGEHALECGYLSLFETPLSGPLVIRHAPVAQQEACLLYLPGHPSNPLRQFPSMAALGRNLTRMLWQDSERAFFIRYVSQARQPRFATRLRETLYPRYPYAELQATPPVLEKGDSVSWIRQIFPNPHHLWQETLDKNARLPWAFTAWPSDCFSARARTAVERRLADAATLAVPVAQRDAAAQLARIEHWLGVGMNVLNVAGFFLPGLAELMLVVGGAQIVDEFLEGVHEANEGQADAAIGHLFDVFENIVLFTALGAAGHAVQAQGELHDWHPVGSASQARLWSGELAPFSHPQPWPDGTPPTAQGLYRWQGRNWVQLDGRNMPLEPLTKGTWRLAPSKGYRHQPRLLGNAEGSWVLEHERPLAWPEARLLARLGPSSAGLDLPGLQLALRCSGYDGAALREMMIDHQPIPALLLDSLETFGAAGGRGLPALTHEGSALARDFPALSPRACDEILAQARPGDLTHMQRTGRLPLALAERARLHLREARINRALARFAQSTGARQDRDALAFAALARLPGWTGEIRIELREGARAGRLLAAAGPQSAQAKTLLLQGETYQPLDEAGQTLANRGDLFQAILQALPDSERTTLNLEIHDAPALRQQLFELAASDRRQAALDLHMAPVRPQYRLPTRLPGDGRLGYQLSGRSRGWLSEEQLFDQLYPTRQNQDRETLRAVLRQQAGNEPGAFAALLRRLQSEYRQTDHSLQQWVHDPEGVSVGGLELRRSARQATAQRIRQAWRRENADASGSLEHVILNLDVEHIGELPRLPAPLPHVRQLSLSGLEQSDASNLGEFLRALPRLQHLDLAQNNLTALPAELGELAQLEYLDLSANSLDLGNEDDLTTLSRLTQLRHLNLASALDDLPIPALERLAQLPALPALHCDLNNLQLSAEHFQVLQRWPALNELALGHNDITLDEASQAALAGLDRLQTLSLYDNPLDLAPDVTGWHQLQQLDLENAGIGEWPTGLLELMNQQPLRLRLLDLSSNSLSAVPQLRDTAFVAAVRAHETNTFLALDGNPFDEQALQRLGDAGLPIPAEVDLQPEWGEDWPHDLTGHMQATQHDPHWRPLYELFQRMEGTADYQRNPHNLRQRMQHIVRTLATDPVAPTEEIWGLTQVQQQITDLLEAGAQTCVDQASLLFQQVETEVAVWRAVSQADAGTSDLAVAVNSAATLLRQHLLDERIGALYQARVARRTALTGETGEALPALHPDDEISDASLGDPNYMLDELEMGVYARMQLQTRLGLPTQPSEIRFDYLAQLNEATLERVAQAVQTAADAQRVSQWAVDQPFWQGWIRRLQPAAFDALARDWEGASAYFDELSQPSTNTGAYTGIAVPVGYIEALEQNLGNVPGLSWRLDGVLQRIDLASNRYAGESGLYRQAGDLLLKARQQTQAALLLQLTEAMAQAHLSA
ncbi:dermonecrotic toxin domain-containing protein [Pseudomonas putida]